MPYPLLDSFHFPLRPSTLAHAHRPLIPNHFHAFPCAHARRPFSTYCHPCPFACTVRALPRIHASSRPPVSIHPLPPTDCLDVLWLNNGLVPRVAWHWKLDLRRYWTTQLAATTCCFLPKVTKAFVKVNHSALDAEVRHPLYIPWKRLRAAGVFWTRNSHAQESTVGICVERAVFESGHILEKHCRRTFNFLTRDCFLSRFTRAFSLVICLRSDEVGP